MRMNPAQLSVSTPTDLEIVMTRQFNAPRQDVWRAMTEPELLRRWLFSPEGWKMTDCTMDNRVGGRYRWAWSDASGTEVLIISGVNKEVTPPSRMVHTETMQMPACGGPVGELLATIELTEKDSGTFLKMTLVFDSKQARDGALASGMEQGVNAGYMKLDGIFDASVAR